MQLFLSSLTKLEVFNTLQKIFNNSLFLFHQDLIYRLFINFNITKLKIGFRVIIYHIKGKLEYFKDKKMAVFFIFAMFLGAALQITNTWGVPFIDHFKEITSDRSWGYVGAAPIPGESSH